MKVNADCPEEPPILTSSPAPPSPRFKALRAAKDDLKGFYRPPGELWDKNFVGEALSESDNCHPENTSFIIGASGGVLTGLITGFFSHRRIPRPINTPIPSILLPRLHNLLANSVILSSTAWRVAKRTLLGTVLYAVLECDFKDLVIKEEDKFKGSIAAGAVCGGIFGLRGGLRGAAVGVALFSSLPGALELYKRQKSLEVSS